jgi:glucokinase
VQLRPARSPGSHRLRHRRKTAQVKLKAGAESKIRDIIKGDLTQVTGAIVGQAAQAGDVFAQKLIAEVGTIIGRTVASLLHAYNPSVVIFGGGVSMLGDILLEPVRTAVREYSISDVYWRDCSIVPAALGDDAGLVGAGALAMEETKNGRAMTNERMKNDE